jgi:phage terminase large subunit
LIDIELGRPNQKQELFFLSKSRFTAYGGARGGGKSWAVRFKATLLGAKYPGIKMLLLRRTYAELRENHIVPLQSMLKTYQKSGLAKYKDTDKVFEFINGSRLKLGYLDCDNDVLQYQGQEYDIIFLDEATQFTEFMFNTLKACLRGANDFPKRFYLTCNPGGIGHEWVKRLFVDRIYSGAERPEDYTFIRASVYDNKAIMDNDPEYVKMLETLPEGLKQAWLYGNWDVFEGQYFNEWRYDVHTCEPFEIPKHWRHYTTMDYGLDKLAHYHIAVDTENNAYVYREIYESGLIVSEAVKRIQEIESKDEYRHTRLAPPDLWNTQSSTGKSTAILFSESGLDLIKSNNDRVAGWLAIHELLKIVQGVDGMPTARLKIFRNCVNLIRTLPLLQYDDKHPNDTAQEPHEITHAPDALRYFAIGWTSKAKEEKPEPHKKLIQTYLKKAKRIC